MQRLATLENRETKGGLTHLIWLNTTRQDSVRLEKVGDYFYLSVLGADGKLHRAGGSFKLKLTGPYYFGLGVCPHDDNITETMEFSKLRIEKGAPAGFPKQSTLQTMSVANQAEQIAVISTSGISEAAWSADGKALTYRSGGAGSNRALNCASSRSFGSASITCRARSNATPKSGWS